VRFLRRAPDRRAAILVPWLGRGDAVGNDCEGLARALGDLGVEVEVFAAERDAGTAGRPFAEAARFLARGRPLAIYQLATRWDAGFEVLRSTRAIRVVRDHNVTPARFFAFLGNELAAVQTAAAEQRAALAADPAVALLLAASRTNADELVALGAAPDRTAVVPPFGAVDAIPGATEGGDGPPARADGEPAVALFVGRLVPHKGHRRAMRVAAVYAELYGEPLRLRFVGASDGPLAPWRRVLEREELRLGLSRAVEWHAGVDDATLARLYATADVFLCCSEHEGFCVPLVEATRLGVPVVASHLDAVRDTLGPDALVLPADASDDVLAAAVRRVVTDRAVRGELVRAQRAHVASRFSPAALTTALESALRGARLLE
jgi:glycosyltransferase involved in cell wall biosynthesis